MKKLLFVLGIGFLAIILGFIVSNEASVIILTQKYEIRTSLEFLFFSLFFIFILMLVIIFGLNVLFRKNIAKYAKREKKLIEKYNNHMNKLSEAFIFLVGNEIKQAEKKKKDASRYIDNSNLLILLEAQIFYTTGKYIESAKCFKKLKGLDIDVNIISLKLKLQNAKELEDDNAIKKYSEQIIRIKPNDEDSIINLYRIYKKEKLFENCEKIFYQGLKFNIFDKAENKDELIFINTCLANIEYKKYNYKEAVKYAKIVHKLDKSSIPAAIILVNSYIRLNNNFFAVKTIKETWKENPQRELGEIYMKIFFKDNIEKKKKLAEKLYHKNSNNFESNLFLSKFYLSIGDLDNARRYAKKALMIQNAKEVYEILLAIEKLDSASNNIIDSTINKIENTKYAGVWICKNCGKEYNEWNQACNACNSVDSIIWSNEKI